MRRLYGDRPSRMNPYEPPTAALGEPVPPDDLTDAQQAVWTLVVDGLRRMCLLSAADTHTITAYVVVAEKLHRLGQRMTKEPDTVRNPANGLPMPNPVFNQWLRACSRMESLSNKLGLNPAARAALHARITTPAGAPATGAERLLR